MYDSFRGLTGDSGTNRTGVSPRETSMTSRNTRPLPKQHSFRYVADQPLDATSQAGHPCQTVAPNGGWGSSMSWQEDLRRLDADLAAGRIEPGPHRKQRDELLAQASGSTVPSPVPSPLRRPGASTWHSTNPAYGQQQPAPPWRVQAPQPRSETPPEQLAQPIPARPPHQPARQAPPPQALEKTLSPGSPGFPDHLTTAPSPADIVPTRYLRVDGRRSGSPSRFPSLAPGPGRPAPPPAAPPGPAGSPQVPHGRHRWGDETPAPPSRSKPTWLFLTLGVLLAVALVAAGTWWVGDKFGDTATGPSGPPAPPGNALDLSLTLEGRLPLLPGTQSADNSTMSIDRALAKKAVTKADADLITASGANEIIYRATSDPANVENGTLLLAIPTPSMIQAKQLVSGLRQNLVDAGFTAAGLPPGEDIAFTRHNDDGWVSALWYASGPVVVGLGVSQPHSADPAPLRPRLEQILDLARRTMPVG